MKKFSKIEKINKYFRELRNRNIRTPLDSTLLGRPGLINNLIVVGESDKNPVANPFPKIKSIRPFEIRCALTSIPLLWESSLLVGSIPLGRTLLRDYSQQHEEPDKLFSYTIEAVGGIFYIYLDKEGYFASASSILEAESWWKAVENFNTLINPFLSKLSWQYNVPLTFSHLNVYDKENNIHYVKFVQAIEETKIEFTIGSEEDWSPKLQALYSFYREMLNSTSASYRFLCIYKALMMANLIKKEIEDGLRETAPSKLREFALETTVTLNDDEVNKSLWPECIGYKLNRFIDKKIRPLRNKVAHEFLDDETEFSNPDVGIFKEMIRDYGDALISLLKKQIRLLEDYLKKSKS